MAADKSAMSHDLVAAAAGSRTDIFRNFAMFHLWRSQIIPSHIND